MSVFHLPKNSGNSGRVVNGTRLFGSFQWKFSGINGIPEKVVPFSRWKLCNGKFVFIIYTDLLSYHQFHAFRGLLSGLASLEWGLVTNGTRFSQTEIPNRKFPNFFVNGKRPMCHITPQTLALLMT